MIDVVEVPYFKIFRIGLDDSRILQGLFTLSSEEVDYFIKEKDNTKHSYIFYALENMEITTFFPEVWNEI